MRNLVNREYNLMKNLRPNKSRRDLISRLVGKEAVMKDQTKNHPNATTLTVVVVTWNDAFAQPGWDDYEEGPLECVSTGFLIRDSKESIVLAQNFNQFQFGEYMTIPKGMVKKIKKLK